MADDVLSAAETSGRFKKLYTGALTDVMFDMGYGAQALPSAIGPLRLGMRLAGPAVTIQRQPFVGRDEGTKQDSAWEAVEAVPPNHVAVYIGHSTDRSVVGDLVIAALKVKGCAGIVVDGGCRDVDAIAELDLPFFCSFTTPQDASHGRGGVFHPNRIVTIGEVTVSPGDYVVGDADGVVVVPAALVGRVLAEAEALAAQENEARDAILRGEPPRQALQSFEQSGPAL